MATFIDSLVLGYIDPSTGYTVAGIGGWLWLALAGALGFLFGHLKNFFKKKYVKWLIVLLILAAGVIIGSALIMKKTSSHSHPKIVVLGFDGLSPILAESMMADGKLPHFSALKNMGSYSLLATTNPAESPVAWSTFATGHNPGKSGIFDFIVRDPKTFELKLSLSNMEAGKPKKVLKSQAFWEKLSERKFPVTMISCPITFPPDKISGRMLSGMGVPDLLGTEGTFTYYTTEALDKSKDTGGQTFQVPASSEIQLNLIGPKVQGLSGNAENVKIPFTVKPSTDGTGISISRGKHSFFLRTGSWSDWQEASFPIGPLKTMKGIFKFYLSSSDPLKLYISPINFDPRDPYFQISYPKNYSKELADKIGLYYTLGMPMETWGVNEGRLSENAFLEQVRTVHEERVRMLEYELSRFSGGLLFCYFEDSDIIQHMFWRYTDPAHPLYEPNAPDEYKKMIETWYKKLDAVLGKVLQSLKPDDTLLVLSDHGFDTFRRSLHLNSWLRQNGYLQLNVPENAEGAELLSDIDWNKTKAYAIGFGGIYLNLKGREKFGIVNPGKESQLLRDEIASKLKEWVDEKDGQRVIRNVHTNEKIFQGPFSEEAPDLYVGFNVGYQASWQTALGAVPATLIEDNLKKWSGSHLFDPELVPGVLFSNRKISKPNPGLQDFAPTFLKLASFKDEEIKNEHFDGEPLF